MMWGNYPDGVSVGDPSAPWNRADPERTCGNCLLCKDVGPVLACVKEVLDAESEEDLYMADLYEVGCTQEPCDDWKSRE